LPLNSDNAKGSKKGKDRVPLQTSLWARGRTLCASEQVGFVVWVGAILLNVANLPGLWVVFFARVSTDVHIDGLTILWSLWLAAAVTYRRYLWTRASPHIRGVMSHAEMFVAVSMVTTMCSNLAYYNHTPGPRLRDVGFQLIPEQGLNSPWRPISDVLTIGLPISMGAYSLFRLDRAARCQLFVDWFRLVAIAYIFRAMTSTLTSLPGPAPHCSSTSAEYGPPSNWRDIVTRMGPLYGNFKTCGDLLFSGHAAWTTVTLLLSLKIDRNRPHQTARKLVAFVYLMTMCVLAISGRKHYTVDLALGVMVASLTFCQFEHGWSPSAHRAKMHLAHIDLGFARLAGNGQ